MMIIGKLILHNLMKTLEKTERAITNEQSKDACATEQRRTKQPSTTQKNIKMSAPQNPASLYQGNNDSYIISTDRYIHHMQVLVECCYV